MSCQPASVPVVVGGGVELSVAILFLAAEPNGGLVELLLPVQVIAVPGLLILLNLQYLLQLPSGVCQLEPDL